MPARAQDPTDPEPRWVPPQLWNAIIVSYPFAVPDFLDSDSGRELYVRFEAQPRFDVEEAAFSRLQLRPSVGMQITPSTEVAVGAMGVIDESGDFIEYRTWQQVSYEKKLAGVVVVSRTRLEQRYPGITASVDPRLGHRIRQMIQMQIPLTSDESWLVIFSDEVHFHATESSFGKAGFDQNRVALRVAHEFSPHVSIEAGPTYHASRNPSVTRGKPLNQMNFVVTVKVDLPAFRKKKKPARR